MAALTPFNSGNDWLENTFFLNRILKSVVIPNALLASVYKKKCISALNFRKCHIF